MSAPNTYFTNRMAPADEINAVFAVAASQGEDGIVFCTPQQVKNENLSKILIRWKSATSTIFIQGEIKEIAHANTPRGRELVSATHARPWSDLADHQNGSALRIASLKIVDAPAEAKNLRNIQSCKYITI
jgi:hypothetical protein